MAADTGLPTKLSPRKQRENKSLNEGFFGIQNPSQTSGPQPSASLLSSSPAFATPLHPIRPFVTPAPPALGTTTSANAAAAGRKQAVLPILLPPATLRPLAFRTFTKKHSLTLTSSALQEMATFIGRHCGSGWREEGLAERVLEETAKSWKNRNCGFIVDGYSAELKEIFKTLEGNMSGGRFVFGNGSNASDSSSHSAATINNRRGGGVVPSGGVVATLSRENSLLLDGASESEIANTRLGLRPGPSRLGAGGNGKPLLPRQDGQLGTGDLNNTDGIGNEDGRSDDEGLGDPRQWLRVIGAFDQPRLIYNVTKKHFERDTSKPSLMPNITHETTMFRNRFNVVHQRLLRNELFQSSAVAEARATTSARHTSSAIQLQSQGHKITPVANLLGRHGTHHMLLGMLVVLPTGSLSICDLSASIALDLSNAVAIPADSAWFTPGMIVLADGVYEEEEESAGRGLNGASGVGGTIGGRFQAFFVGQPPAEKRKVALGISGPDGGGGSSGSDGTEHSIGGGFGWIDFLGVGSQRAVGARMRKLEQSLLHRQKLALAGSTCAGEDLVVATAEATNVEAMAAEPTTTTAASPAHPPNRQRIVVLGELHLDQPRSLQALKKILSLYAGEPEGTTPLAFVLMGNFTEHAVMTRGGGGSGGSIEYKEYFNALAAVLADYPSLIRSSTFVFVPGDNDGWESTVGSGAAVPLPRKPVPDVFTSRVRRVFATANSESPALTEGGGEAVWTTNPSRLSLFGPNHEIVLFRDDISSRLRRTAVRLAPPAAPPQKAPPEAIPQLEHSSGESGHDVMDIDAAVAAATEEKKASATPGPNGTGELSFDVRAARKLVKTILDQGYLAPFKSSLRPVHWDFSNALHLYPLPTALILADTTAPPFCITYEGCHVINPSSLLVAGRRGAARWVEYEVGRTGRVRECTY